MNAVLESLVQYLICLAHILTESCQKGDVPACWPKGFPMMVKAVKLDSHEFWNFLPNEINPLCAFKNFSLTTARMTR